MKSGVGYFIYAAGKDMATNEAFYSADGDFLIVPQHGVLDIQTELGRPGAAQGHQADEREDEGEEDDEGAAGSATLCCHVR